MYKFPQKYNHMPPWQNKTYKNHHKRHWYCHFYVWCSSHRWEAIEIGQENRSSDVTKSTGAGILITLSTIITLYTVKSHHAQTLKEANSDKRSLWSWDGEDVTTREHYDVLGHIQVTIWYDGASQCAEGASGVKNSWVFRIFSVLFEFFFR